VGFIDQTTFKLSCPKCGAAESVKVLDQGSNWSGSHWQSSGKLDKFEAQWKGGGKEEPEITSAACKSCGSKANVQSGY
jgi:hypothetical protein